LLLVIYPLITSFNLILSNLDALQKVFASELYWRALLNTFLFLVIAVPIKMILALFLSGFINAFKKYFLVKIVSVMYLLPWSIPAISSALSFRWMLNYDYGIINMFLTDIGLPKVGWLLDYQTALFSIVVFHVWKWTPLWTLMLLAARQAIPDELYEAAKVDGANISQSFVHITWPMLKQVFLTCMTLTSVWSIGEFEAIWLITLTGPNQSTNTITTLGFREVFIYGNLINGLAIYFSILPVVLVLVIFLLLLFRRRG